MKKVDNYAISRDRAQRYFLSFDQEAILRAWPLESDAGRIYVTFLGEAYAIMRETGQIYRQADGTQAGFSEVLSIFDFLCHPGAGKQPSGRYAPVNSLEGSPKTGGVGTDFYGKTAGLFHRDPQAFAAACQALGAQAVNMGDIGYRFTIFDSLQVILKFYRADEDFPPSITLLWDTHLLRYIHYETVFYIAGFLLEKILHKMKQMPV